MLSKLCNTAQKIYHLYNTTCESNSLGRWAQYHKNCGATRTMNSSNSARQLGQSAGASYAHMKIRWCRCKGFSDSDNQVVQTPQKETTQGSFFRSQRMKKPLPLSAALGTDGLRGMQHALVCKTTLTWSLYENIGLLVCYWEEKREIFAATCP